MFQLGMPNLGSYGWQLQECREFFFFSFGHRTPLHSPHGNSFFPHVLFSHVLYTFICCLSPLCVFCGTILIVQQRKCFFQRIVLCVHSTQTHRSSTREKSLTTTSYSISCFMSRPHIISANISCHRLTTCAFKAQSKCIYAFDPISLPLYHVAVGLLGSLSVGSNLRPQIEV